MKYKLTNNKKEFCGVTLFQIEATKSFDSVNKGELGGYIEKESNLSQDNNAWVFDNAQVFDNAVVCGNATVCGNARVSAKALFTRGLFIGGDDSGKITDITDKVGNSFWKHQYVLGDYKIETIDDTPKESINLKGKEVKIILGGVEYTAIIK